MQNNAILKDEQTYFYFKMMMWMCSQFGPPVQQGIAETINAELPLHLRCWDENGTTPVLQWASGEARLLAQKCGMENWPVQFAPIPSGADLQTPQNNDVQSLNLQTWNLDGNAHYFVDNYGRPIIYYDPSLCKEKGYFSHMLIPRLAQLKLYARRPPQKFTPQEESWLTRLLVCHLGLGFTLLACTQSLNKTSWRPLSLLRSENNEDIERDYLHGTLMTLSAHKLTAEQILARYGSLMSEPTRKRVEPALRQIEKQADAMKLLRRLSKSPKKTKARKAKDKSPKAYPQRTSCT